MDAIDGCIVLREEILQSVLVLTELTISDSAIFTSASQTWCHFQILQSILLFSEQQDVHLLISEPLSSFTLLKLNAL